MHPGPAFAWTDETAILAFAAEIGFAHIFAATPEGPMLALAPVTPGPDRTLRFHLARANRLTRHLDGLRALLSVAGPEGYVSPNWYANTNNQVPTWNYVAAEIEGGARRLDEEALIDQLDTLAAAHEPRVNPAAPWTRDKMDDARFSALLSGIVGFEIEVENVRANRKLGQNKPPADRAGVIAGLRASDNAPLAEAMEQS